MAGRVIESLRMGLALQLGSLWDDNFPGMKGRQVGQAMREAMEAYDAHQVMLATVTAVWIAADLECKHCHAYVGYFIWEGECCYRECETHAGKGLLCFECAWLLGLARHPSER